MIDWIEIKTDIDFSKYNPISTNNSLHIYEELYEIDGKKYRLLYIIGGDNKPIIETQMNQIEYSVLKFRSSAILDERVNIGLLILLNKELKFIYPKTLTRLKYLFPNVDLNRITEILESFENRVNQFQLLDLDFESIRDNHLLIIDDNSIFFGSKLTTQTNNQDNFIKHYTDKYFSSYEQRTNE